MPDVIQTISIECKSSAWHIILAWGKNLSQNSMCLRALPPQCVSDQRRNARLAGHGRTNLTANTSEKDLTPTVVADLPFWTAHWWKVVLWWVSGASLFWTNSHSDYILRQSFHLKIHSATQNNPSQVSLHRLIYFFKYSVSGIHVFSVKSYNCILHSWLDLL